MNMKRAENFLESYFSVIEERKHHRTQDYLLNYILVSKSEERTHTEG